MKDYQSRMVTEYRELKKRYEGLHKVIVRYDAGTLDFTPTFTTTTNKLQQE